ncbi:MAG TPA: phosphohistidine phosphatase SixA [Bacteroidota bacterium]|nr:phosphohistidine phosphatase SixA [Bacteroidota bacterium]
MKIILLRHGIAVPRGTAGYPNDDRPLTPEGTRKMVRAARGIADILGEVEVILTSPMKRAEETARIVAAALGVEHRLVIVPELAPGESLDRLMKVLAEQKGVSSLMIVGHEPDLGYLASALIGSTRPVFEFKKGAVCAIEAGTIPPHAPGRILWHLPPKILRSLNS